MSEDKTSELAQRIRDEELLVSRGYVKEKCKTCAGTSWHTNGHDVLNYCGSCQGRGWVWKAPLMR